MDSMRIIAIIGIPPNLQNIWTCALRVEYSLFCLIDSTYIQVSVHIPMNDVKRLARLELDSLVRGQNGNISEVSVENFIMDNP